MRVSSTKCHEGMSLCVLQEKEQKGLACPQRRQGYLGHMAPSRTLRPPMGGSGEHAIGNLAAACCRRSELCRVRVSRHFEGQTERPKRLGIPKGCRVRGTKNMETFTISLQHSVCLKSLILLVFPTLPFLPSLLPPLLPPFPPSLPPRSTVTVSLQHTRHGSEC